MSSGTGELSFAYVMVKYFLENKNATIWFGGERG